MDEGPSTGKSSTSGTSGENLEEMIQQFCKSLTDKLKDDPQTFTTPIRTFLSTYNKMTDGSLMSALHCFGKAPQVKSKNLQSSKMIGVQPTAIARRKMALGGRRALIPGQPPKCSRMEHQYSKQQLRKSAPHSVMYRGEHVSQW